MTSTLKKRNKCTIIMQKTKYLLLAKSIERNKRKELQNTI